MLKKILLSLFLSIIVASCTHYPQTPQANQPYLDAEKMIRTLPQEQYRILSDQSIYIGPLKNGQATGFGKIIMPDGSVYQGEIQNGKADGLGKSTMSTREIYQGKHKQGHFEGYGRLILSDGSIFIGTFRADKAYRGEIHFPDGGVAELK